MTRAMALDVGDATVGIALSDALRLTAQGRETWRRKTPAEDMAHLKAVIAEEDVSTVVIGLPRHMNGEEGERCKIVREFAEELTKAIPEVKIAFWDERLSTVAAEKALLEADVSRRKRKKVIDKLAAVIILQGYLDSRSRLG